MPDHKQKSFELLTGYPREDQLSGKEMITAFQEYAKTKDSSTLNLLFLHNEDDLKGMLALTSLGSLKQLLNDPCQITDVQEMQEPNLNGAMETKLLFSLSLETPVQMCIRDRYFTWAKSLTRFRSRFASLGVPLERFAISSAPSSSVSTPSTFAE